MKADCRFAGDTSLTCIKRQRASCDTPGKVQNTHPMSEAETEDTGATRASSSAALLRLVMRAIGLAALKREAAAAARATALRVALTVAAGIFWLLVLGYLLATFTIWLAGIVGSIYACLIVAAIFALIALVLHLVAARMARRRHRWNLKAEMPNLDGIDQTTLGALAVAALAGFFVGNRGKH
jgi:Flp pilus assembly protein TadB